MMVWLSFAEPGEQGRWLGVAIVEIPADKFDVSALITAVQLAKALNINPGGELVGSRIAPERESLYEGYTGRLLTHADMKAMGAEQTKKGQKL